jgi:hypothetical protein
MPLLFHMVHKICTKWFSWDKNQYNDGHMNKTPKFYFLKQIPFRYVDT